MGVKFTSSLFSKLIPLSRGQLTSHYRKYDGENWDISKYLNYFDPSWGVAGAVVALEGWVLHFWENMISNKISLTRSKVYKSWINWNESGRLMKKQDNIKLIDIDNWLMEKVDWQRKSYAKESQLLKKVNWQRKSFN